MAQPPPLDLRAAGATTQKRSLERARNQIASGAILGGFRHPHLDVSTIASRLADMAERSGPAWAAQWALFAFGRLSAVAGLAGVVFIPTPFPTSPEDKAWSVMRVGFSGPLRSPASSMRSEHRSPEAAMCAALSLRINDPEAATRIVTLDAAGLFERLSWGSALWLALTNDLPHGLHSIEIH